MSGEMDLGVLSASLRLDPAQFDAMVTAAPRRAQQLRQNIERALAGIDLALDDRGFTTALQGAQRTAQQGSQQISRALAGTELDLDTAGFDGALQTARRGAASATTEINRSLDGISSDTAARGLADLVGAWPTIERGAQSAATGVQSAMSDVTAAVERVTTAARAAGDQAGRELANGISSAPVEQAARNLGDQIDGRKIGEGVGGEMGSGLAEGFGGADIGGALQTIVQRAKSGGEAAGGKLEGYVLGGMAGLALGMTALFTKALEQAMETSRIEGLAKASLGSTSKAAGEVGKVAGELYARGLVDSVGDAGEQVIGVIAQTGVAGADEIGRFSRQASAIATATGQDASRVARAAQQMVRTGLVGSLQEAFDLLAAGQQSSVNAADDMIDIVEEYGVAFQQAGISGKEAFGLMNQVVEAGGRNADLAADAIKEYFLKVQGGSDATKAAFQTLGFDYEVMARKILNGGDTGKMATQQLWDAIDRLPDPATRASTAVEIFGTKAEDLGRAIGALDIGTAADGFSNVAGRADQMATDIENSVPRIEKVWRGLVTGVAEAVEKGLGGVEAFFGFLGNLPGPVQILAGAVGALALGFYALGPALALAGRGFAAAGLAAKGFFVSLGPVGWAVLALSAGATALFTLLDAKGDDAVVDHTERWDKLRGSLDQATGAQTKATKEIVASELQADGWLGKLEAMGVNTSDLVDASLGVPGAFEKLNRGVDEATKRVTAGSSAYQAFAGDLAGAGISQAEFNRALQDGDVSKIATKVAEYGKTTGDAQGVQARFKAAVDDTMPGLNGLGDAVWEVSTYTNGLAMEQAKYNEIAKATKPSTDDAAAGIRTYGSEAAAQTGIHEKYAAALQAGVDAAQSAADSTGAQMMLNEIQGAADDASRTLDIFRAAMLKATGRDIPFEDAAASWNDSIRSTADAFKGAAEQGGYSRQALLDWNVAQLTTTEGGAALHSALSQQVTSYQDLTAAAYSQAEATGGATAAQEAARAKADELRQAFLDQAVQQGFTREEAGKLADELGIVAGVNIEDKTFALIADDQAARDALRAAQEAQVTDKRFMISADAETAQKQADNLNQTLNTIDGKQVKWAAIGNVVVSVSTDPGVQQTTGTLSKGQAEVRAHGGWIGLAGGGFSDGTSGWVTGPGGATDDLVVAQGPGGKQVRVSPTEFVMRGAIAEQIGPFLEAANAGDPLALGLAGVIKRAGGGWIGLAGGGSVGSAPAGLTPDPAAAVAVAVAPAEGDAAGAGMGEVAASAQAAAAVIAEVSAAVQAALQAIGDKQAWLAQDAAAQWGATVATTQAGRAGVTVELDTWRAGNDAVAASQVWMTGLVGEQWATTLAAVAANRAGITGQMDAWNAGSQYLGDRTADMRARVTTEWATTGSSVQSQVTGVIVPAMDASNRAAGGMQAAHESAARGVIAAWGTIKAGVAEPVNWVLQNVWNQGILPAWGQIREWLPSIDVTMGPLSPLAFAKGGVAPGYSPGNDTLWARVSPGEGFLVPEAVRGLGGPAAINAINEQYAGGRIGRSGVRFGTDGVPAFFAGGVWDGVPSVSVGAPESDGKVDPAPTDQMSFVKGFAFDAFDTITALAGDGLGRTQAVAEGSPWGRAQSNLAANAVGAVLGTLKTMFGLDNDGKGGNPVVPGSVTMDGVLLVQSEGKTYTAPKPEGARGKFLESVASQMGTPYVWGAAGPSVFDCSGLMSWALEQAGVGKGRMTADAFHKGFPHVTGNGKPGDMPTYSARYSKESGMAGHIGVILDPAQNLMMHTDGAGPARVQEYQGREGGPLSIVDAIGGAVDMSAANKGVGELPAILAQAIYGNYGTNASAAGALDPAKAGDISMWESTRLLNTVDPIANFGPMNMARGNMSMVGPVPPGDPVNRWAPMYASLLAATDRPASNLPNILGQVTVESTGDPLAYNDYDSNFTSGKPSKSLLQTIPSTFRANAAGGYSTNIWHPPSNGLAAMNYVDKNYGGVFPHRAYKHGGEIVGHGGPFDDATMIAASPMEFMVNAPQAQANLPLLHGINSGTDVLAGVEKAAWAAADRKAFDPADLAAFGQPTIEPRIEVTIHMAADGSAPRVDLAVDGRKMAGALVRVQGRR